MILAHTPDSATVKAYQTYDFFEHRQPAMQQWADLLTSTMGPAISTTQEVSTDAQQERKEERKANRKANSPVRTSKAKETVVQAEETREGWHQAIMPGWA
jgi:hypothetical protein